MISISPGQALLVLIDHYKLDKSKTQRLEKLYLCGAGSDEDRAEMVELFKDPCLSDHQINYDSATINDDPTRRYFETHLAYQTLTQGLDDIDVSELKEQLASLKQLLPSAEEIDSFVEAKITAKPQLTEELEEKKKELIKIVKVVNEVLDGTYHSEDNYQSKECADYIAKIKSKSVFKNLSTEHKEKIILLVQCSYLGMMNAQLALKPLPIDIYAEGFFSTDQRGRVELQDQETTVNSHMGLLKGHMPLASTDLAQRTTDSSPHIKGSDLSTYDPQAAWPKANFETLVNPFSNSISGTILCQLRSMRKLVEEGEGVFTESAEKMEKYFQLLTSSLLFNHGGHSLFEFTYPLSLEKVQDAFYTTPDFADISMESMFLMHNKPAFNTALKDAVTYNNMVLMRAKLHAQVKEPTPLREGSPTLAQIDAKASDLKSRLMTEKDKAAQILEQSSVAPSSEPSRTPK